MSVSLMSSRQSRPYLGMISRLGKVHFLKILNLTSNKFLNMQKINCLASPLHKR